MRDWSPCALARAAFMVGFATCVSLNAEDVPYDNLSDPPHLYWQTTPRDRFTRIKADLESGRIPLDRSSEKAFVLDLLRALDIPPSSQLLLFSTTSLQIRLISPATPRALYFRDDTYLGYIPRGRIEVISLDPELGAIFHIFDIPSPDEPLRIERSDRCMNCHAGPETRYVPGLLAESVMPGPNGGSLESFRNESTGHGHGVPLRVRFGGWYLTGQHGLSQHWANLTGRLQQGDLITTPVEPGSRFAVDRYPGGGGSDIVAHLVHEHQIGFINRCVEAAYRARAYLHAGEGGLSPEHGTELDRQARILTRYLLFADEVPLTDHGIQGDASFMTDFLRDRRPGPDGRSLKEFNLKTRLFENRCSYMIYSPIVDGLPGEMKTRLFQTLKSALDPSAPHSESAHLSPAERAILREILAATCPDFRRS